MKTLVILGLLFACSSAEAWQRTFNFTYKEIEYSFSIQFDDAYINNCRAETKRWQNSNGAHSKEYQKNINKYVESYPCPKVVQTIAEKLHKEFLKVSKTRPWEEINFNIAFVNHLHYELDSVTYGEGEYYATPFETIDKGQQDCEDSSFLLSHLFYILGYNSLLITLSDHVAVCVDPFTGGKCFGSSSYQSEIDKWSSVNESGTKYYYCESTPNKAEKCYQMGTRPKFAQGKIFEQQLVVSESQKKEIEKMEENVALVAKRLEASQNRANTNEIRVKDDFLDSDSRVIHSNGGALYIEKKQRPVYVPLPDYKIPRFN